MTRRVLYVQYTNPAGYPPLEHSAWLLAEAGFDVRFFGTDALGDSLKLRPHPRIRTQLAAFRKRGALQKAHYIWFSLRAFATALLWRPSWIYASDPLSCPPALLISWLPGSHVIYHEHDSPSRELARGGAGTSFMRLVMRARRALAERCVACVLPNDARARAFREDTGVVNVLTVWNCPMRDERISTSRAVRAGELSVFYHGSIVPARLPETVIAAIAQLPSGVSLTFAGYETAGHPGYVGQLLAKAAELGVADRVRHIGTVPTRQQLLRDCAASDVGLALMPVESSDINEQTMVGASNKPFDYLACGLPLLVTDLSDWTSTYVEAGFGRSCDPRSAPSIAASLRWFLEHPAERIAMGDRGREKILSDWNYEKAFEPVVARVLASGVDWAQPVPSVDPIR
jgi:glycosyltransferase involved in cell wall biosynthesis